MDCSTSRAAFSTESFHLAKLIELHGPVDFSLHIGHSAAPLPSKGADGTGHAGSFSGPMTINATAPISAHFGQANINHGINARQAISFLLGFHVNGGLVGGLAVGDLAGELGVGGLASFEPSVL